MSETRPTLVSPLPTTDMGKELSSPLPTTEMDEELPSPRALSVQGTEEAVDQLRAMLFQELTHYPPPKDYLNGSESSLSDCDQVAESWRRRICEWIFEVVDHFGFDREVVSIALDYLDRSASLAAETSNKPLSKREFQLFAVSSLYIAVKLHGEMDATEGARLKLKISSFQELSNGFFQVETIEAMERRILPMLNWRANPPTSTQFVARFFRLLPEWSAHECTHSYREVAGRIFDVAKYLTELSCFNPSFTFHSKPSVVAYASILCAIEYIRKTMPLPFEVQAQFLKNIAAATKVLVPDTDQVTHIQGMLKDLSPSMFACESPRLAMVHSLLDSETADQELEVSSCGSPICVYQDSQESQRKRLRTR
jgi:hypothetical protein